MPDAHWTLEDSQAETLVGSSVAEGGSEEEDHDVSS